MTNTAFVTGGTGFLGHHLVQRLRDRNWRVVALVRERARAANLAAWGAELVLGDLSDGSALARVVPDGADAFFHVAANTAMWKGQAAQIIADNVGGTRNALIAAQARRTKRFVLTSSAGVWGLGAESFDEESPMAGRAHDNPYLDAKLDAEHLALSYADAGGSVVILHPGHLIGAGDTAGWARSFADLQAGRVPLAPPGVGTWSHVGAVADAHIAAAEVERPRARYLLGGPVASYRAVLEKIAQLVAAPPPRGTAPAALLSMSARFAALNATLTGKPPAMPPALARILNGRMVFRSDRAQRELGYAYPILDAMLQETHEWLAAHRR